MVKLEAGTRVGQADSKLVYSEYGDEPCYGVITDVLADGRVMVKWDDEWKNRNSAPVNPQKLQPEETLKTKWNELEAEFKRVEVEVKAKIKEASTIILDAHKLAKEAGLNLYDMSEATSALESAMGRAGWNTSSWGC